MKTVESANSRQLDEAAHNVPLHLDQQFAFLKAPITTAADDIYKYFFILFQRQYDLMFQVNPLLGR